MQDSPLFLKYLGQYEENPKSLVFAPLAEAYRKFGQLQRAQQILVDGLKIHPHYDIAKVILAACYLDSKRIDLAYKLLSEVILKSPENLKARRLLALASSELGLWEESLSHYKYLLFITPKDEELIAKVTELEKKGDWLSNQKNSDRPPELPEAHWQVEQFNTSNDENQTKESDSLAINLTMCHLYLANKLPHKALEILAKFEAIYPGHAEILQLKAKIRQINTADIHHLSQTHLERLEFIDEDQGETYFQFSEESSPPPKNDKLKIALNQFLEGIQSKSLQVRSI